MNARLSPLSASIAAFLSLAAGAFGQQQPGAPVMRDQQDMINAEQLSAAGKYADALKLYEGVPKNYPTSAYIPGSNLGTAICYFFLKQYDKAAEAASRNFTVAKDKISPEVLERSYVLVPQIYATKAQELPDSQDTLRKKSFQDAIKGFDDVITKFPASIEVENALYGKGRAMAMVENYEGAAQALQQAMDKYPQSPSFMDTKFMKGLVLAQQGSKAISNQGANAPGAKEAMDEAEKTFREVIGARSDLALMNASFMQLGDVLSLKAGMAPRDSDEQKKLNEQALDQFRQVRSKDEILAAQEARINFFANQIAASRTKQDLEGIRKFTRQVEKEREKLETLKAQPDQSLQAKLKSATIFLALGKYDEARVMLRFVEGFLGDDDKDSKKRITYYIAVTYAAQHVIDKAEEAYKKFTADYKNDPIGENLNFLMGDMYLDEDPKIKSPDKAMKYFDEQIAQYPNSPVSNATVMQKALALKELGKSDEAVKALQDFINKTTDKAMLAQAQFNLALILKEMGKTDQSVATFKTVRDNYPTSPQAEQAAFWLANILVSTGDNKAGLTELNAFISKYPESSLMASALYFKARAQSNLADYNGAVTTYKQLIEKFPDAEPVIAAYFEMAGIFQKQAEDAASKDKPDYTKVREVMQEFIAKYPDSDRVYSAFAFSAQLLEKEEKQDEAVKTYEDFISSHAADPAVAKAHLAIATIQRARAEKLGSFLSMAQADQEKWKTWMDSAIKNAEQGIEKFPESDQVASLLEVLLKIETLQLNIGQKKADDVKAYFTGLAAKFNDQKSTKAKVLFALANFLADRDREKKGGWFEIMDAAYDPSLVFSASDIDRYGNELVNRKNYTKAKEVFDKLAKDYPVPPNTEPGKVTRSVGEAQSVAMAGNARILQAQGKGAEGQAIAEELKRLYPWSGKVAEADYQIAVGLIEQGKLEEGIDLLGTVIKKTTVPVPLRANGMMVVAKALEKQQDYDSAVNNYIKIATFFESERELAAEGLFRGAQILEEQANGKLPLSKPKPKITTPKPEAKAATSSKPAESASAKTGAATSTKPAASKPGNSKAGASPKSAPKK